MNQEEIENMNRPITSPEIEPVILKTPNKQTLGQGGFTGKFYQTFREELIPILLKLLQKLQRNSFVLTESKVAIKIIGEVRR